VNRFFKDIFFDKCFVFKENLYTNRARTDMVRSKQDVTGLLFLGGVS